MKTISELALSGGLGSLLVLVFGVIDIALLSSPRTRWRASGGPPALVGLAALASAAKLYERYSDAVIPRIGKAVAADEESYRYLVESIRKHPDQETLKGMMEQAGFERAHYFNLSGGIVALHKGYKF